MSRTLVLAVLRRRACNVEGAARREAEAVLDAVCDLVDAATEVAKHTETLCVGGVDIGKDLSKALARVTGKPA